MKCDKFKPSKIYDACTEYTCKILGGEIEPRNMCDCICCANHELYDDDEVCKVNANK